MFVYCIWSGDRYENERILLYHSAHYTEKEFKKLCNTICKELINSTTMNPEIMDTVDSKKSIWEYSIDYDLMTDVKKVLIKDYGFQELKNFPKYHVIGVDPYDYDSN